jgi:3-dehydroquinate dehydratase-2
MKILVINGPNLNMLGIREPDVYGKNTYADLVDFINKSAKDEGVDAEIYQSNHEGDIVDKIQDSLGKLTALL